MLFLARLFLSTNIPGLPPQKGQGPRQPLTGLSGPLLRCANAAAVLRAVMPPAHRAQAAPPGGVAARAFSTGVLPAFQPVTSFAFSFCFRVRLATGSLAWAMPHDPLGWRRVPGQGICEDGGGVAVAGVAPKRRSLPALCTAASRPPPALAVVIALRVAPDDRFAVTAAALRSFLLLPEPGATSLRADAVVRPTAA